MKVIRRKGIDYCWDCKEPPLVGRRCAACAVKYRTRAKALYDARKAERARWAR